MSKEEVSRESYVKTPPSKGPATEAIAHMLLMIPIIRGLLCNGTAQVSPKMCQSALGRDRSCLKSWWCSRARSSQQGVTEDLLQCMTIRVEPVKRPPTPAPAMALPTIKTLLLGAVAQIKDLNIVQSACIERELERVCQPNLEDTNGGKECAFGLDNQLTKSPHLPCRRSLTLKVEYIRPKLGSNAALVSK